MDNNLRNEGQAHATSDARRNTVSPSILRQRKARNTRLLPSARRRRRRYMEVTGHREKTSEKGDGGNLGSLLKNHEGHSSRVRAREREVAQDTMT